MAQCTEHAAGYASSCPARWHRISHSQVQVPSCHGHDTKAPVPPASIHPRLPHPLSSERVRQERETRSLTSTEFIAGTMFESLTNEPRNPQGSRQYCLDPKCPLFAARSLLRCCSNWNEMRLLRRERMANSSGNDQDRIANIQNKEGRAGWPHFCQPTRFQNTGIRLP